MTCIAAIAAAGLETSLADRVGGWAQGCLVLLVGIWLFLALLGIRTARFPWRILGGLAFIAGSALWLGLHPSRAAAWELDAGYLGFAAQQTLMEQMAGSPLLLNLVGALLAACSVLGLLVAIDWLPLLPFAPLLAGVEGRLARASSERAAVRATQAAAARQRAQAAAANLMHSASATLAPPAPRAMATEVAPSAPPPVQVQESAAIVAAAMEVAQAPIETSPAAIEGPPASIEVEVDDTEPSASDLAPPSTQWDRFRPRAHVEIVKEEVPESTLESGGVLPVDNEAEATHNTSLAEGASRSEALPPAAAPADVRPDAALEEPKPSLEAGASPEPEQKDLPVLDQVLDQDRDLEALVSETPSAATALLDGPTAVTQDSAAVAPDAPLAPTDETLAPRRKKEEDDEPAEEPAEDPDKEPDEEGEEEPGAEPDEEGEDEEEWEEEEEEGDKEEKEEEEKEEEWDDDEDDDDDPEDEDDEDDEEEDEDEDDEDVADDDDEDDGKWDDDESSSTQPAPQSSALLDPTPAAVEFVTGATQDVAPALPAVPTVSALPDLDVESVALPSAPVAPTVAPLAAPLAALPPHLFRDLPDDERELLHRAVSMLLELESVSLSKLQRELGITYYSAARVFERLEKDGYVAPYSGSLARAVKVTRSDWEKRLQG